MSDGIRFRCTHCNAKLRASIRLVGQIGTCPKCRGQVIVKLPVPSDADIVLVPGRLTLLDR